MKPKLFFTYLLPSLQGGVGGRLLLAALLATTVNLNAQTIAANYKAVGEGNPISSCVFCADPTAIEYQGRLYVYGTNDHQQYIYNGKKNSNGYGNIK